MPILNCEVVVCTVPHLVRPWPNERRRRRADVNNGSSLERERQRRLTVFTLAIKGHFGWFSPSLVFLRESRSKSAVSQLVAKLMMLIVFRPYFYYCLKPRSDHGSTLPGNRSWTGDRK